jgi:capsular polysaccharide biosynthesis protein
MRRTGTLVGASGAALANLCFLPPGARVVEIRPMGLGETWLEIATANLGLSHRILRTGPPLTGAAVPLQARLAQLPRRITGRYAQAFRCDIPAVLAALAGP